MRYGSVCSGIEAATAAWHHMGWEPAFFSEIEAFPRAVLEHHYPDVPLHGDFTTIEKNQYGKIDLLVGGTPCQSFSVAGLRGGLDDERGNLALEFCRLAQREQPRWVVWENVPGVLSSNGGRDFGSILGALEDLGYGLAYRVLDAQYFGVAQRRRRVFVVGYLGDWRPAAAVLFERHSMSGHPAPSREARKEAARAALSGAEERGGCGGGRPTLTDVVGTLTATDPTTMGAPEVDGGHYIVEAFAQNTRDEVRLIGGDGQISGALAAQPGTKQTTYLAIGFNGDQSEKTRSMGEKEEQSPTLRAGSTCHVAISFDAYNNEGSDVFAFSSNMSAYDVQTDGTTPTLKVGGGNPPAVAYDHPGRFNNIHGGSGEHRDVMPTLEATNPKQIVASFQPTADCLTAAYGTKWNGNASATNGSLFAHTNSAVRRLTPVECERLQGFPDNFTAIPWKKKGSEQCPDGPRYKALGNSMAVPVMRWIGERIQLVDDLISVL